jgi:hypothetical protein
VEVVQPDGGRALVVGKLDAVPKVAGGCAMRIVVCDAQIKVLAALARPSNEVSMASDWMITFPDHPESRCRSVVVLRPSPRAGGQLVDGALRAR